MNRESGKANSSQQRQSVVDALLESPDVVSVLRLTIVEDTKQNTLVVAASIALVETLPVYVISHALEDAKRRVKAVVGEHSDVFIEPDLVKDPERQEPPTDVIVIRASD